MRDEGLEPQSREEREEKYIEETISSTADPESVVRLTSGTSVGIGAVIGGVAGPDR